MDLLAEEMLELLSNLKVKLFLLQFKMGSCYFEWFLLPIGELVEPILNFNKSSRMFPDFGPLGRGNAGTDFELKTQAIPVEVQNEFMQF